MTISVAQCIDILIIDWLWGLTCNCEMLNCKSAVMKTQAIILFSNVSMFNYVWVLKISVTLSSILALKVGFVSATHKSFKHGRCFFLEPDSNEIS